PRFGQIQGLQRGGRRLHRQARQKYRWRSGGAPHGDSFRRAGRLQGHRFTLGGEYFSAKNWTQINALPSDKADGWSVFGSANVVPKISVFGRYDWVKPHKDTLPNLKDQYFNAGVQYEAFKNVDFSLVYKHDKAENGTISTSNGTIGGSTNGTYDEIGVWGVFQF
ncbi:MAG: hypothetical protein ACXWI4_08220, partial [Croceibacterium sp.]